MNESIRFAEWIAEAHYHLYSHELGTNTYYWYNEEGIKTTEELYKEFVNYNS
jgi:hypothetical protein